MLVVSLNFTTRCTGARPCSYINLQSDMDMLSFAVDAPLLPHILDIVNNNTNRTDTTVNYSQFHNGDFVQAGPSIVAALLLVTE